MTACFDKRASETDEVCITGLTARSEERTESSQYTTVSRKLPTITAMATIMDKLTASAATETDTRGRELSRFADARRISVRQKGTSPVAYVRAAWQLNHRIAGVNSAPPNINSNSATKPNSGCP